MTTILELLAEFEADREAFETVIKQVLTVDTRLRLGPPYIAKDGKQLTRLDEVLHAINNDQLIGEEMAEVLYK